MADLFDKDVDPRIEAECEKHMSRCAECREYYDSLQAAAELLTPRHSPVGKMPNAACAARPNLFSKGSTLSSPSGATGVFRVATECGYGPTKGSESPIRDGGHRGGSQFSVFNSQFKKLAAMFAGVILLSGIAYAAIHLITRPAATANGQSSMVNRQSSMVNAQSSEPVRFEDVRLDSILSVVSAHYAKGVRFSSDEAKAMKFILTWKPDAPLAEFIDGMNMFDGLLLTLQRDTIFVEVREVTEEAE